MQINIVDYESKYHTAFRSINTRWIEKFFTLEDSDRKVLDYPDENIIAPGGAIVVALIGQQVAGVCALIKMNDPNYDFELAKMAVHPSFQGLGIGFELGVAIIAKAKALSARNIYLESNDKLFPALKLYEKLKFKHITGYESPYERCNVQMALEFD